MSTKAGLPWQIQSWRDIEDRFADTLVLGNGASIAVDPRFAYHSLIKTARDAGLVTPDVDRVFQYLDTHDFELVLSMLWHAHHVNQALGIRDSRTANAYAEVRNALVQAVQKVHAEYREVESHLPAIYEFMKQFKHVVSLNYDLIVYWTALKGNDVLGRWFKDCFVPDGVRDFTVFDLDLEKYSKPYGADGATLIFYPHGNLALATSLYGQDVKIRRKDATEPLLSQVVSDWRSGEFVPLFVSEGDNRQKRRAILRSDYLETIYDSVLPKLGPTLVIYGCSLHDSDDHILTQLLCARIDAIAVSVHAAGKRPDATQEFCSRAAAKLRRWSPLSKILFFEADSPGCWIHK